MLLDPKQEDSAPLLFNGIDGATGNYLMPELSPRQVAKLATGERFDPEEVAELKRKWADINEKNLWAGEDVDEQDLTQAGWGVIFAPDITDEVKSALAPLLELRKAEAGQRYTDFPGARAYRSGDDKNKFLSHSGMGPGTPNTKKVPYYLLIVGSPESVSYRFQYQLDVQYAVGRIHFDTPQEYRSYARSVVKATQGDISRPRQAAFFGVRNRADRATQLSADHLIKPLRDTMSAAEPTWKWTSLLADDATKSNLSQLLGGERTPALLVTASHGMGFPNADQKQASDQGALLCQDWPGPLKHKGPIPEEFYLAGRHVLNDASVEGLIAFFFACYGGGTPKLDDFAHLVEGPQATIAPKAFVGSLPKGLLAHPAGGALAVIGHVERAWTYSFMWEGAGEQSGVFENALIALANGKRIGSAMEYFNSRYSQLSSDLIIELENRKYYLPGRPESETRAEDETLAGIWTANNDARSYVVLGDPAVRLAVNNR
jgi:Peptidase family C25